MLFSVAGYACASRCVGIVSDMMQSCWRPRQRRAPANMRSILAPVRAAGLALAVRIPELKVTPDEIDAELCALAAGNAKLNGLMAETMHLR